MDLPEMQQVTSSNVESIGYDENSELLYVHFLNGSTYVYKNVPKVIYEQLINSPSIGSYMHRNIKGLFPCDRVG